MNSTLQESRQLDAVFENMLSQRQALSQYALYGVDADEEGERASGGLADGSAGRVRAVDFMRSASEPAAGASAGDAARALDSAVDWKGVLSLNLNTI